MNTSERDAGAALFSEELEMLRRSWIPVAHASELQRPGDYVSTQFAGRSVVVTRTTAFGVAAFQGICPHRGTLLFDAGGGHLPLLEVVCPYHGLRTDLTGRVRASDLRTFALKERTCLTTLPVTERHGFVFAKPTPGGADFDAEVGPLPPWFGRTPLEQLRRGRRTVVDVEANWKLCVENFQESHHFPEVHPSLERVTPAERSTSISFGGLFLGGTMQLDDDAETVSEGGRRIGAPFVASPEDRRTVFDALMFPVWMTSLQPDYFLSYLLLPLDPRNTTIVADIYFHQALAPGVDPTPVYAFWDRTNLEDQTIVRRQQRGLDADPTFEGTLTASEDGIVAFRQVLARQLRRPGAS